MWILAVAVLELAAASARAGIVAPALGVSAVTHSMTPAAGFRCCTSRAMMLIVGRRGEAIQPLTQVVVARLAVA